VKEAMKIPTVLIADHRDVIRRGLCTLLEIYVSWKTVTAKSGREAVAKVREIRPDIAILAIDMPDMTGLEAARQILKETPRLPLILLSANSTKELKNREPRLKADTEDLVAAVQAVLQSGFFFTGAVSRRFLEHLRRSLGGHLHPSLTRRQTEIVQLLCEGKSNKEVARALGLSSRTVENQRAHIMQRLGFHSFSELIRYAIKNGIAKL
jgi:DNA-binding NarL/FixJ family response regulator